MCPKTWTSAYDGRAIIISNGDLQNEQKTAFLVEIQVLNETVLSQDEHEARNRIELGYIESIDSDHLPASN